MSSTFNLFLLIALPIHLCRLLFPVPKLFKHNFRNTEKLKHECSEYAPIFHLDSVILTFGTFVLCVYVCNSGFLVELFESKLQPLGYFITKSVGIS